MTKTRELEAVKDEAVVLALAGACDTEKVQVITINGQGMAIAYVEYEEQVFILFTEVNPWTGAQWAFKVGA